MLFTALAILILVAALWIVKKTSNSMTTEG